MHTARRERPIGSRRHPQHACTRSQSLVPGSTTMSTMLVALPSIVACASIETLPAARTRGSTAENQFHRSVTRSYMRREQHDGVPSMRTSNHSALALVVELGSDPSAPTGGEVANWQQSEHAGVNSSGASVAQMEEQYLENVSGCSFVHHQGGSFTGWQNSFDDRFNFQCPSGQLISGMGSVHSNGAEDRKWKFKCSGVDKDARVGDPCWTAPANGWDDPLDARGSSEYDVAVGVESWHHNGAEDRKYKWKFCRLHNVKSSSMIRDTRWTPYDDPWTLEWAPSEMVVHIMSIHSNSYEDRKWQFHRRQFCATPVDCQQGPWGKCDKPCGGGIQRRDTERPAKYGGKKCGPETRECHTHPCNDCVQSEWTECSKQCGGGTQTRDVINDAGPGGKACGPNEQSCNEQDCPKCDASACLASEGKILKSDDTVCATTTCTTDECCEDLPQCKWDVCMDGWSMKPSTGGADAEAAAGAAAGIDPLPKWCADKTCTNEECCYQESGAHGIRVWFSLWTLPLGIFLSLLLRNC